MLSGDHASCHPTFMAKRDLSYDDLEALIDAGPEGDCFRDIDAAVMRRMSDFDLRRVLAAIRSNNAPTAARIYALAEQELADRAAAANRWTMFFAAAGVVVGIVGIVVAVL